MRRHFRRLLSALLVATAAWTAAGCGGGGGGGGGGPTDPTPGVTFTPAGSAGANSVALAQGADAGPAAFALEVRVNQVTGLYGVAFDLSYPAALLAFLGATEGAFLGAPGAGETSLQVAEAAPGRLVVGLSRLGDVDGATGSGTLLTLRFAASASGSQPLGFSQNAAYDAAGQVQAVSWVAGSVTVVR